MNIKRLSREEYAALVATGTREELLAALRPYVAKPPGRPATGKATTSTERMRILRQRAKMQEED